MNFEDLIQDEDLLPVDDPIDDPNPIDGAPKDDPEKEPTPVEEAPIEDPNNDDDDDLKVVITNNFKFLKEVKLLDVPEDFEFDGKPEQLEKALEVTKSKMQKDVAEALWDKLPEDFKPLLEYGLQGGKSLNEYLNAYGTPVDYENYPIETTDDQKKIVFESFKLTSKYDDEKILKMIKSLEVSGDLEEAAQEAKEDLISYQAEKKSNFLAEQKKLQQEEAKQYEQYKASLAENIDKTPYDSLRKNRLKQVLFNPIKVGDKVVTEFDSNLDAILSNPEHLIQLADLVADYNPKVGFKLDRLKKQLKSESTTEFKKLVQENLDTKPKVTGSSSKQSIDESKIWQDNFDY